MAVKGRVLLPRRGEAADLHRGDHVVPRARVRRRELLDRRVDEDALRGFLERHAAAMPRTALRYAIERFSPAERKRWLGVVEGRTRQAPRPG